MITLNIIKTSKFWAIFIISFFSTILLNFLIWIIQGIIENIRDSEEILNVFNLEPKGGGWPFLFFDKNLGFSYGGFALDIFFWFFFVFIWFLLIFALHDMKLGGKDI